MLHMTNLLPPNPYHHDYGDDPSAAPFAGRSAIFARLYQHAARSDRKSGLCILGRRHTGKTALLHAIRAIFADSHLSVIVPLREMPIESETDWYLTLAQQATAALIEGGYTVTRLSNVQPPEADPRQWFTKEFLPQLLAALRTTRRLLWLIDDADEWLAAVRSHVLPEDSFTHAQALIAEFAPIDMVITLDAEHEASLPAFAPLIQIHDVVRLGQLTREDTAWVLREPARDLYQVDDSAVDATFKASGGAPGLIQQFGYLMYRKWTINTVHTEMSADDVKAMIPTVYAYGERDFIELWQSLSPDERLTLTAMSSLTYADPITPITAARIEAWLVETDFPRDMVAVHAALRGLEYREAIVSESEGARINGDLLQSWLLDHARLGEKGGASSDSKRRAQDRRARVDVTTRLADRNKPKSTPGRAGSVRLMVLFALALLISTAILIASLVSSPRSPEAIPAQPTATLISTPAQ